MRQEALRAQPELAAAIENPERFAQLFRQMQDQERRERMMRQQRIAALNADPFDVEAQMRIAEMIREERVQENLQNAIEHNPEGACSPESWSGVTTNVCFSVRSSPYALY
jgi:DNA damage-inducible protein 1